MKAVGIIADPHLDSSNFQEVSRCVAHFIENMKKKKIKHVLMLGDWFLIRKHQTSVNLELSEAIMDMFFEADIHLHCIDGNHDKVDQTKPYSYLSPYRTRGGMTLYSQASYCLS